MTEYYVETGYAKSDRSSCRGCKEKIQKGAIRIAISYEQDHYQSHPFHHLDCFYLSAKWMYIKPESIRGFLDLEPEDRTLVRDRIQKLKSGQIKKPKKKRSASKNKKSESKDKSKDKSKGKKKSQSSDQKQYAKNSKSKQLQQLQGYNAEQLARLKEIKLKIQKYSCDKLRFMLTRNNQVKTGSKGELVERVADGMLLGAIPKCPKCRGGRPKFQPEDGLYRCKGYHDDQRFVHCHGKFTRDEIDRTPWQQQVEDEY